MGFRFSRRIKLLPGVSVNLSKSGASLSVGPRGAKVTVGPRGVRQTVGIPGTGLYYTTTSSSGRRSTSKAPVLPPAQTVPPPTVEERLTLSFFKRLVTPDDEEDLVAGMKAMVQEDTQTALACFKKCAHLADAAFLAGVLLLKQKDFQSATTYLEVARNSSRELGKYFQKYGLTGSFDVPITAQITAKGQVGVRLLLLILVEAYQAATKYQEAVDVLNQLHQMNPDDLVVKVSRSELLLEAVRTKDAYKQVIELAAGVGFSSEMEAVLLLYKAEALRQLGLLTPSLEILDSLWGKRSLWNEKLLLAIRFERGCVCEAMGDDRKARTDWEYVYAKNPNYEGVAERLGL